MDAPPERPANAGSPDLSSSRGGGRDRTTAILTAAALASAAMALTAPFWTYAPVDPFLFSGFYAGGAGFLIAGLIGARRPAGRPIARFILLCATLYFLGSWALASLDVLFTMGLVVEGFWLPVGAHLILAFPSGRLRSGISRLVLLWIYAWATAYRAIFLILDPRDLGCEPCPPNLLLVRSEPDIVEVIWRVDSVVSVISATLIAIVLVRRWHAATLPERRVLSPVFAALAVLVALVAASNVASSLASMGILDALQVDVALAVANVSIVLLPIGLIIGQVRSVLARASIANLLVRIGQGRTATELERDVAWALGDPSVRISTDGTRSTGGGASIVESTDGAVFIIRHDPAVGRYQPELLRAVMAAVRVALDNERLQAEATLTKSVSPGLAERLQREGRRIGEIDTITISVLMSDIRGYTTLAEAAELQALAHQLQRHRVAMNEAVASNGGVVMQFVGDAVFAVFGAPEPLEDHALMAVRAGIDMQTAQRSINAEWAGEGLEPFRLGIGITSGEVAAALLGSSEHVEYSLVGDVVNLAQRLQTMSDGDGVIVDEATWSALDGEVDARPLPATMVKGRRSAVAAFRIDTPATIGVTGATPS